MVEKQDKVVRCIDRSDRSLLNYYIRIELDVLLQALKDNEHNGYQKNAIIEILKIKTRSDLPKNFDCDINFSDENNLNRCAAETSLDDLLIYHESVKNDKSNLWRAEELLNTKRRNCREINSHIQQVNLEHVLYRFWENKEGNIKNIKPLCNDEDELETKFINIFYREIKSLLDDEETDLFIDFRELDINIADKNNLICLLAEAKNYRIRTDYVDNEDDTEELLWAEISRIREELEELKRCNRKPKTIKFHIKPGKKGKRR